MNYKAMNMFLSEDNINEHLDYLYKLRLKYSLLVKSIPEIKGKNIVDLLRSGINRKIQEEAIDLLWQIKSHELFFDSFAINTSFNASKKINNLSYERFIYDFLIESKCKDLGFMYICKGKNGQIVTKYSYSFDDAFIHYEPILCIDLFEHTYFLDYRFNKEKFLKNALVYFDIGRIK